MMLRTVTITILLTGLLAKNYLIEVADEEDHERAEEEEGDRVGSDFSVNQNFKMELDGHYFFK